VRSFIAEFGRNLGLETIVDETGNVIVRKPATKGMEDRKGIILQAHLDMVPQQNSGSEHDFGLDPIETVVDGGWVRANGTTLGADNGIGVAAAMAVLESRTMAHGAVEALFTCEEETGMTGASGLKPDLLRGDILMNLDSEDEGELFIGCAGGVNGTMSFFHEMQTVPPGSRGIRIRVTGLKGGHSGMDIDLGRGNANKIMNRILHEGRRHYGLLLASIEGGSLRNAIPRESFAHAVVPEAVMDGFLDTFNLLVATIKNELSAVEPDLDIKAIQADLPESVIEKAVFSRLLKAIHACPNGVMRMSSEMEGLVETSNNLAIVKSGNGRIVVECLLRSSVNSARKDLETMIGSLFELAGAVPAFHGGYPGWKPNPTSPILKTMKVIYTARFGTPPLVRAVHAGLECGIIGGIYPALDMISFGPTIRHPHSPDEKVEIASVRKFWDFIVETLARIPRK
jgi:dipeptidase D